MKTLFQQMIDDFSVELRKKEVSLPYSLEYTAKETNTKERLSVKSIANREFKSIGFYSILTDSRFGFSYLSNETEEFGITVTTMQYGHTVDLRFFDISAPENSYTCYIKNCEDKEDAEKFFKNAVVIVEMFSDFYRSYDSYVREDLLKNVETVPEINSSKGYIDYLKKLGFSFSTTKLKTKNCDNENCKLYSFEGRPYYFYEFDNEQDADKSFEEWATVYSDISAPSLDGDSKYKKCVNHIKKDNVLYVVIKSKNFVFVGTDNYYKESELEKLVTKFNYFK